MSKPFSLALLLLCFFSFRGKAQQLFVMRGFAQGTDYAIRYYAEKPLLKQSEVDSLLQEIDLSMSLYRPDSKISIFNAGQTDLQLDIHLSKVLQKSFEVYKRTSGKFDITVAPLVQAWGFGVKPVVQFPDSSIIQTIMPRIGMDKLEIQSQLLKRKIQGVQIDLNGIAQGYSVDLVADLLLQKGITAFVAEIGGELRIQGRKPGEEGFKIGVEGPGKRENSEPLIRHVISFDQGAVTTSGNYRKYLEQGKNKISHLINPQTGFPLDNQLISVTVFAPDALTADGYDNALMAMEPVAVVDFVSQIPGMEVYLIYKTKEGKVEEMMSDGFKQMIVN